MFFTLHQDKRPLASNKTVRSFSRGAALCLAVMTGGLMLGLSGCGGGSGGSGGGTVVLPNVTILFTLLDATGAAPTVTSSVTIGSRTVTAAAGTPGTVTFDSLQPGTMTATFSVNNVTSSAKIVVGFESSQRYVLVSGSSSSDAGVTITGRILFADSVTNACSNTSLGVSSSLQVRVRDVNQDGNPIVASATKPDQTALPAAQQGVFVITKVPGATGSQPRSYIIDVAAVPNSGTTFTGDSGDFSVVSGENTLPSGISLCAGNLATPPPVIDNN